LTFNDPEYNSYTVPCNGGTPSHDAFVECNSEHIFPSEVPEKVLQMTDLLP